MRTRLLLIPFLILAAGCGSGGGGITIRGDLAGAAALTAGSVWAVEAEQGADVRDGAFEIGGLVAGPLTLRLMAAGDTVGQIEIPGLPNGATLTLHGLRVDERTGRAFPASIELEGADAVLVNGVRMAPAGRVPTEVAVDGTLLARSDDGEALLLRPDDRWMPDLRVVVGLATETVTPDGDPVDAGAVQPGDSLRVEGRSDNGFVVASRLVVPRRLAAGLPTGSGGGEGDSDSGGGSGDGSDGGVAVGEDGDGARVPTVEPSPARVISGGSAGSDRPGRAEPRGKARGQDRNERGKGKGRG